MPKVSVIIPVYNVADHIIPCIDSLLYQTLTELEVVLVDDHGQDDSIGKVKQHIANHHRKGMFLFTKTPANSGPGVARNVGMQQATGEYVAFLDSDDWVEPSMYDDLYQAAMEYTADICYCNAMREDSVRHKSSILTNPPVTRGNFSKEDKRSFLTNYVAYLWTFIYRREFLIGNGIFFPASKSAEDSCFIACCVLCAKRVGRTEKTLYHYVVHNKSLTQTRNEFRYSERMLSFQYLLDFAKDRGLYDNHSMELDYLFIKKAYLLSAFDYLKETDKPKKRELVNLENLLRISVPKYKENCYFKRSLKIRFLVLFLQKARSLALIVVPRIIM